MANKKNGVQNVQNSSRKADKAMSDIKEIKNGLEQVAKIKSERDFLLKSLNEDCIGKVFRGVERLPNGDLKIAWDVDPEANKATDGYFHSYWTGHDIGIRNGCDAAGLLWKYISLSGHEDFDLFIHELDAYVNRTERLGTAMFGNLHNSCCDCCDEDEDDDCGCGCPEEVRNNCPQDCEKCPEDLHAICQLSIDQDPQIINLAKEERNLLKECNDLLEGKNSDLQTRLGNLEKAIRELAKKL